MPKQGKSAYGQAGHLQEEHAGGGDKAFHRGPLIKTHLENSGTDYLNWSSSPDACQYDMGGPVQTGRGLARNGGNLQSLPALPQVTRQWPHVLQAQGLHRKCYKYGENL